MTDMCCESFKTVSLKFAKTSLSGYIVNHCPYLLVVYHFLLLSLKVRCLKKFFCDRLTKMMASDERQHSVDCRVIKKLLAHVLISYQRFPHWYQETGT